MKRKVIIPLVLIFMGTMAYFLVLHFSAHKTSRTNNIKNQKIVVYQEATRWPINAIKGFNSPFAIAVNQRDGTVFVTDSMEAKIFQFSPKGELIRSFGESGEKRGMLDRPTGITIDSDGNIYVADYNRDKILKYNSSGIFQLEWGQAGKSKEDFESPTGLSTDENNHIYVADFQNNAIKVFTNRGEFLNTFNQQNKLHLTYPTDLHVINQDEMVIADAYGYQVIGFQIKNKRTQVIGKSILKLPTGVVANKNATLIHVADSASHRIVCFSRSGAVLGEWTMLGNTLEHSPTAVALSPDGKTLYVTDTPHHQLIVLTVRTLIKSKEIK